ncbi:MAG: hypothetical protein FWE74_02720 [Oscillospiraceae bacterium]|nr:hypothetical protein [Oscillospiraceae bacterium]
MKSIKKPISLLLTFAVFISFVLITPVTAAALNPSRMTFEEYIVASLESFTEAIDIGYYIRNNDDWLQRGRADGGQDLASWLISGLIPNIIDNNPRLFNVTNSMGANWYTDFSMFTITPDYIMTPAQYTEGLRRFNIAAIQALGLVRHARTDFEKALILHNYIALNTTYDSELLKYYETYGFSLSPMRPISHTAYGALVDGLAVCDGYAKAYIHLLGLAGIESRIASGNCVKSGISHAWAMVKLDGSWYHADPTWNAPANRPHGTIIYDFFLLSGREINKTHVNWEWATADGRDTDSTKYSNAFFRSADSAVVILGDYFYWLESTDSIERGINNNSIMRHNISTGRTEKVHDFEAIWYANGTEHQAGYSAWQSHARIAAYDGLLYFNTAKEILSLDPETGRIDIVHTPSNLGGSGNRFIFGMTMNENVITFTVQTEPSARGELLKVGVPFADEPETDILSSADALLILRYGAGLITLTVDQRLKYDLNGDGVVNTADAIIILRKVAGIAA